MNKPTISAIIPTRGNSLVFQPLIESLLRQSYLVGEILLVVDKDTDMTIINNYLGSEKYLSTIVKCIEVPTIGGRASSARNYGARYAQPPVPPGQGEHMLLFLDDDVVLSDDTIQRFVDEYTYLSQKLHVQDIVLFPQLVFGESKKIQSLGFSRYHYRCGWPEPVVAGDKKQSWWKFLTRQNPYNQHNIYQPSDIHERIPVQMFGYQCVRIRKDLFLTYPFDEDMPFVYEDLNQMMKMTDAGVSLFVIPSIVVYHYEAHRDALQKSYISSPSSVYQKVRNRILFVRRHATLFQKVQFFGLGLRIGLVWFVGSILMMSDKKGQSLLAVYRGMIAGLSS